jgi:hypothetical protein
VRYSPAGTQKSVEQLIIVTAKLPANSPTPYNFSANVAAKIKKVDNT